MRGGVLIDVSFLWSICKVVSIELLNLKLRCILIHMDAPETAEESRLLIPKLEQSNQSQATCGFLLVDLILIQ